MKSVRRSKGLSPIFVIVLTVFIDVTGFGIIIPLLPFYANEFQAGPTALGVLIASFAIMQFFFSPLLGKASDKKGRKPILLISLLFSFISFTIFSFANSYFMLLFSRIIAGIATERAVAQAYIADVTDKKTRTKEMGKIGAALGAGFIIGPALGGILSTYGFSIPGYAAMILTLINILLVISFLPEPQRSKEKMIESISKSSGYLRGLRDSLRKPLLGPTLLILFIVTLAFSTIPVIVPLLSIDFFNFNSLELSYVFIYIGLIQIVMQGFLINPLSKRLGEEKLIALGPILMATGTLLMPIFKNVAIFFFANAVLAAGFGIINTSIPAFLSKRISLNEQGSILGIAGSVASIANIPGPLIIGLIYSIAGSFVPFFISAVMLATAFLIGCRVYSACKFLK
ncbi:MAG TPA: MFS transporter [Candidatus Glassbacteria bacterium]|nr:MFS transporter [Candidatus Glassbacteria bacterium]